MNKPEQPQLDGDDPLAIGANIDRVRERIASACERVSRPINEVTLVAVSKGVGLGPIRIASACGLGNFGESRASELTEKAQGLQEVTWHFIGRIQSNKAGRIAGMAAWVHSIDRADVARRIDRKAVAPMRALVEVNVSGEPSKGGVPPGSVEGLVDELMTGTDRLRFLSVEGLMTMAPQSYDAERSRLHFRRLARIRDELRTRFPSIRHLSMGMSQDYEVAIEEGSTMVRIGKAIFEGREAR